MMPAMRFLVWLVRHGVMVLFGWAMLVGLAAMFGGISPATWLTRAAIVGPFWLWVLYDIWREEA